MFVWLSIELTTDANIELAENACVGLESDKCTLYLHKNKKIGGIGTPLVDTDGTWSGLQWKSIVFVNDDGTPIDPDEPGTVHLTGAGELTAELITTALKGSKSLIITGEMGAADFAPLLNWGTEGLTTNDADLLRNLDLAGVTGLTAVPENAFYTEASGARYSLHSLQRISLPTTVTSVGNWAFQSRNPYRDDAKRHRPDSRQHRTAKRGGRGGS